MECENSVVLESPSEDSVLIQTVKDSIANSTSNELDIEEEEFFVITDAQEEEQNVVEVANEASVADQSDERPGWIDFCRVCAKGTDHFIPIFDGEGLQHELCNKIHKYLPIHVSETDTLPLQLCYHCAATILAWHELSEGCLKAERRLVELQNTTTAKQEFLNAGCTDETGTSCRDASASDATGSDSPEGIVLKVEESEEPADDSNRFNNEITEARLSSFGDFHKAYKIFFRTRKTNITGPRNVKNQPVVRAENSAFCGNFSLNKKSSISENRKKIHSSTNECAISFKVFDSQSKFDEHAQNCESHAKENKNFVFNVDNKKAEPEKDLTAKSIDCELCRKKFRLQESYRTHMRVHTGEKPYTCHICGKQFGKTGSLYYHLKHVHAGVKNHSCDICGRSFAMKAAMQDHRRIHTGERPYVCDTCGKTFKTKASLYIHNKTHTNEYPHKCTYCAKGFRWRQQMLGHLTIHTGEKRHTCDVCGKGFGVRNDLTRHKRVHSEGKPYTCNQCGISFAQKRYLKSHERARHK